MLGLGLLPVATGALTGVAAVSVGFGSVHGLTLGFGTTLIGECVDYAIYLFTRATPGTARPHARSHLADAQAGRAHVDLRLSAMLFSGFPGLAQLGLFLDLRHRGGGGRDALVLLVLTPRTSAPRRLRGSLRGSNRSPGVRPPRAYSPGC